MCVGFEGMAAECEEGAMLLFRILVRSAVRIVDLSLRVMPTAHASLPTQPSVSQQAQPKLAPMRAARWHANPRATMLVATRAFLRICRTAAVSSSMLARQAIICIALACTATDCHAYLLVSKLQVCRNAFTQNTLSGC
jgi:hypothetical protein